MKIVYIGLREETLQLIKENGDFPEAAFLSVPETNLSSLWKIVNTAAVLLIGENTANPIQIAQQVYGYDALLSIVLINDAHNFQKIKQSLLFTPFIGSTVYSVSSAAGKGLAAVVKDHVQRTEQRRSYKKIKSAVAGQPAPSSGKVERVKEEYLSRVLEEAPVGLVLINMSGVILSFNRYAATLFNKPERAVLGTSLAALFPESLGEEMQHFFRQSGAGKQPKTIEYQREGEPRFLEVSLSDVEKEDSSYKVALIKDITDQVRAQKSIEESAQKVKMIVDSMPEMAWTALPDGKVDFLNKRWFEYTGQQPGAAFGAEWEQAIHPEDLPKALSLWRAALQKKASYQLECRYLKAADQLYRWHLTQVRPVRNQEGMVLHWVGTCTEIQSLKDAEQELQRTANELTASNEELLAANEEIIASNDELHETNERLVKVNADMDNFIYTASHDLKAPITNIEGLVEILSRKLNKEERENEQVNGILAMMQASVKRFQGTIADLTEIVKLQRLAKQEPEQISILEMVQDVKLDLIQQIKEANAQVNVEVGKAQAVSFSRKNLKSIIYNLLSNAVKYRSNDRRLSIQITSYKEGKFIVLSVQDNGLGMNVQDEEKIFGMFRRLHSHVEGTGIGLYMVKRIIESGGGRIEVESQPGRGSTFRVYFPD